MTAYSTFRDVVEHTEERRRDFFKLVFGNETGYICIAYKSELDKAFEERFFSYPGQLDQMLADIDRKAKTLTHVYFCPQLLSAEVRKKEYVSKCTALWADLDTCNPQYLQVPASIVVQSSSGRWQALWRLDQSVEPEKAESVCMKIAYFHSTQGADKSGWDLTQLLRVPYTPNYKYGGLDSAPIVTVISTNPSLYRLTDFDCYPVYEALKFTQSPIPESLPQEGAEEIFGRYRGTLNPLAIGLYSEEPGPNTDWSKVQWQLGNLCVEAGMKPEETFKILWNAKCNKYIRDGRRPAAMWQEVQKLYVKHAEVHQLVPTPTAVIPKIISDQEIEYIQGRETFVERYIKWATSVTDAAPQYHQAGAFILLSSLIAGSLRLPTSFGTVIPNMWFMLLADTTLTRKTTAMDIAMDMMHEVNPDAFLATDGSVEGIMSGLKERAKKPSIYLRDEFTGLLEAMSHKDYMSGMAEQLTKLYDGKSLKRLLRREEIHIKNPVFIIFAGGVRTKTQNLLTDEHINSGFIPRFVFITAVADPDRIRPVGPPVKINTDERERLLEELYAINFNYNSSRLIMDSINGNPLGQIKPDIEAVLTDDAWRRYNEFETTMMRAAMDTGLNHLMPVHDRLCKSTLKAAMLLAASTQGEQGSVTVGLDDILHAIYYCRHWHVYASEIVNSIGKSYDERLIDKIIEHITSAGTNGVPRSEIMKVFKLDYKKADLLLTTITQRRLVFVNKVDNQDRYSWKM